MLTRISGVCIKVRLGCSGGWWQPAGRQVSSQGNTPGRCGNCDWWMSLSSARLVIFGLEQREPECLVGPHMHVTGKHPTLDTAWCKPGAHQAGDRCWPSAVRAERKLWVLPTLHPAAVWSLPCCFVSAPAASPAPTESFTGRVSPLQERGVKPAIWGYLSSCLHPLKHHS